MNIFKIALFTLTVIITACSKAPESSVPDNDPPSQTTAPPPQIHQQPIAAPIDNTTAQPADLAQSQQQFSEADQKLSQLMDQIENPKTTPQRRRQLVCQDYPHLYKTQYLPAFLQLTQHKKTQAQLLSELDFVLNDYKARYGVQC